jgi:cytochrome b subunit of formate dehydrogenase
VTDQPSHLEKAIAEQLRSAHGLDPEAAAHRAADMQQRLAPRFATWVRRELAILESRERKRTRAQAHHPRAVAGGREFQRFSLNVRLQHAVMAISVIFLILTGLPLKFSDLAISKAIINFFGGPDVSPIVHRVAASFLIFVGLWHLAYIALTREGRAHFMLLLPRPQDARDAWQQINYFLGRTDERPRFDKFSYVEKFDYWAVYWGMVIMIGSGTVLWFTNQFLKVFPKWFTDIAKEAHSDEALLATLAIVIWHFYNVHFNPHKFPMNPTFITGRISEQEMIEEHPLEYERITSGAPLGPADSRPVEEKGGQR